ncbi:hypothetical protein BB560_004755 [Smittium megazygosporum]|uniref:Uncharacterized protein n=1 Tax=Smittium megazygosporum TaxID=133381 RepID=A0A2T9Z8C5_9FUNG|nr:hypothetical protein BB560_004755 [Smittium megazygosporum]
MSEDHIPQAGSTEYSTQRTELRLPDTMKFDGLRPSFGKHLYTVDLPEDLEEVVKICAKVENRISELQATQYTGYNLSNYHHSSATNKYSQGQNINKDPDAMDGIWKMTVKNVPSNQKANLNIRQEVNVGCLIDTGASSSFISTNIVKELNLPTKLLNQKVYLETVNGKPLIDSPIDTFVPKKHRVKFNSQYRVSNCLEKSTNLDAVFKAPDDKDSDYDHTTDFDQNATNNNPESADTDSDTYETASKGEPDENKTQIHRGNLSSNATLSNDPSEFETLKSTDTLLPREYTIFAPLHERIPGSIKNMGTSREPKLSKIC